MEISGNLLEKQILIGNIYRPPKHLFNNYCNLIEQLTTVFEALQNINCEAVIAGDMNMDLFKLNELTIFG